MSELNTNSSKDGNCYISVHVCVREKQKETEAGKMLA